MLWKLPATDIFLIVLLSILSIFGDFLVFHTQMHLFKAIFDNATHGIIGGISWLIVCLHTKKAGTSSIQNLIDIGLCCLLSSVIDLDHFLAAKSLHLKDATHLRGRPPFHCTSIPLFLLTLLLLISYFQQIAVLKKASLLILTAILSHHTRDATRRGFWIYPFGSTPPIPYFAYVITTCAIPYFIILLEKMDIENYKTSYKQVHAFI